MIFVIIGERIIAPILLPANVMLMAVPLLFTNHFVKRIAIGTVVENALPKPMITASTYSMTTLLTNDKAVYPSTPMSRQVDIMSLVFLVASTLPATGERIIPRIDMMVLNVPKALRLIPKSSVIGTTNRLIQDRSSVKNVAMIRVQTTTIHQP